MHCAHIHTVDGIVCEAHTQRTLQFETNYEKLLGISNKFISMQRRFVRPEVGANDHEDFME